MAGVASARVCRVVDGRADGVSVLPLVRCTQGTAQGLVAELSVTSANVQILRLASLAQDDSDALRSMQDDSAVDRLRA